jgi:hydrogenase-4 component F
MIVMLMLALPLAAAMLVCMPFNRRWAPAVTVAASAATLTLSGRLAWRLSVDHADVNAPSAGLAAWISVDGLSGLMLLLVALVGFTSAVFSFGYMGRSSQSPRKLRLYYANYNLFIFSMLAIPVLAEPTLVWIMVELTTLCSALLVSFENTAEALEAAWKYVVLSLMGAGMALFGFLLLFAAMRAAGGGDYTWAGLAASAAGMPPVLVKTAFVLILIGFGAKAGLVPMHTWLPDAHSQAPSPVCALLSGVETTAVLYVILRLFPIMQAAPDSHAEEWALVLGLISVGTAAFLLLRVRDYKRLFAFSTVEHMGIILTAIGLGASAAGYGAMQQIVAHSVTKSFCFFAAGAALLTVETRDIAAVRGLIRLSPAAGAALMLGGLGIAGAPPLAVFLSEFMILKAGLAQEHYVAIGLLVVFLAIAFFGVMAHLNRMVFGTGAGGARTSGTPDRRDAMEQVRLPLSCRLALLLAAGPILLFGVYIPRPLHDLLTLAAAALTP